MPTRHIITTSRPGELHGFNLEDEIKQATGLRSVDVTLAGNELRVAIPGDRPAEELEALEKQIGNVVRQHKGMTDHQRIVLGQRMLVPQRLDALAEQVADGMPLTQEQQREAVEAWLLERVNPKRA